MKRSIRKNGGRFLTAGLLTFALALGTVSPAYAGDEATTIRIGYNATDWWKHVVDDQQFFEKEFDEDGIEVEWYLFESGAAEKEAIASNNLDIGTCGAIPPMTIGASGLPIKVISKYTVNETYCDIVVPAESDITDISQLKGKKIATSFGQATHAWLVIALSQAGLTVDDVEVVNLQQSEIATAIQEGIIDAGAMGGAHALNVMNSGAGRSILNSEGLFNNIAVFIGGDKFLEENPELTARVLKVWLETMDYINEDKERALDLVVEGSGVERSNLERTVTDEQFEADFTDADWDSLLQLKDFLYDEQFIENDFDLQSIVDISYLEEAKTLYTVE